MRTPLRSLRIPVVVIAAGAFTFVACGDDGGSKSTTSPSTSAAAAGTTIDVTVGQDSSPDRTQEVKVGQPVTLNITDPDKENEFHVHVVDLGDGERVPAGTTKTFRFTPSAPGDIDVESHDTEDVLLVIHVVP